MKAVKRHLIVLVAWLTAVIPFDLAQAYQERVILALSEGHCTQRIEADDEARVLRLRVLPVSSDCRFTPAAVRTLLKAAIPATTATAPGAAWSALFLGRLVDYPWLSQYLARSAAIDPLWNRSKGWPVAKDLHAYVRDALSRPEPLQPFAEALAEGGYVVVAVTVEKVGVGRWQDLPPATGPAFAGKVPFDAMAWLLLARAR